MQRCTAPRILLATLGFLSAALAPAPASAEPTARLLRDIDAVSYTGSSRPRDLVPVPNGYAFTAFDGREIWIVNDRDGTADAVLRRPEIRSLGPGNWTAREPSGEWTLWGLYTFRLGANLVPIEVGPFVAAPRALPTPSGEPSWLLEADDGSGLALWGTHAATGAMGELATLAPLGNGRLARDVTRLFPDWEHQSTLFVARGHGERAGVWSTDGTPAGTRRIFAPRVPEKAIRIVGTWGGKALISVAGSGVCPDAELWTTDGTAAGTRPLPQIVAGAGCARVVQAVQPQPHTYAFLVIDDGSSGRELWRSDGTAEGTFVLTDLEPADPFAGAALPRRISQLGYLFFADDGQSGREPWLTGGRPGGTRRLADLCPGDCGSSGEPLGDIYQLDGEFVLLFAARVPGLGRELWRTDGTERGTELVADLCPGRCNGDPADFYGHPSSSLAALFSAVVAGGDRAQFGTDGTAESTVRLTPPGVRVTKGSGQGAAFAAADAESGEELWRTYGTPETTQLWYDLERQTSGGSFPHPLAAAGERLVFSTDSPGPLWGTDGTTPGTRPLPGPGPRPSPGYYSTATLGGRALVVGVPRSAPASPALWAFDGRPGGNVRLTPTGVQVQSPLQVVGARAFFFARDEAHGVEPWVTDGTQAGTRRVVDLTPGVADTRFHEVFAVLPGEWLFRRYVVGPDSVVTAAMWVSDGTAAGTRPLLDAHPFLVPLDRHYAHELPLARLGSRLVFAGADESFTQRVYTSDGTAAGTQPLLPGPARLRRVLVARTRLYLVVETDDASQPYPGSELSLWRSDGTPQNTVRLASSLAEQAFVPVVMDEGLLFTGPGAEPRLWVTDGTVDGTGRLPGPEETGIAAYGVRAAWFAGRLLFATESYDAEVPYGFSPCQTWAPGEASARPAASAAYCGQTFAVFGDHLFFSGWRAATGAEPWVFDP